MRIKNRRIMQLRVAIRLGAMRDYPRHTKIQIEHYHRELDAQGYVPDGPSWLRIVTLSDGLVMHVRHDEIMKLGTRSSRRPRGARRKRASVERIRVSA